jgi:hypothetical protein
MKSKNFLDKFARAISYIFNGIFISIPIFLVICFIVVENKLAALGWASLCILFGIVIPYIYIYSLYKKKKISDIHIPKKEDRIKPLIVSFVSDVICFMILYVLKAPTFLKSMFLVGIVSTAIFAIITYFWKISIHTSWITFGVITFVILFGEWMLLLILLIPVIGWARVRTKKHTVIQVVLGAGITIVTTVFVYYNYGLISFF